MAIQTENKVYTSVEFAPVDFAIFAERAMPGNSGILYGCTVTATSSNTLHVAAGYVCVKGRIIKVNEGSLAVSLPSASETQYLVVYVNLAANPSCDIFVVKSETDSAENFNVANGIAYLRLAKFTADASTVKDIVCPYPYQTAPMLVGKVTPANDPRLIDCPQGTQYLYVNGSTATLYIYAEKMWFNMSNGTGSATGGTSSDSSSGSSSSGGTSTGTTTTNTPNYQVTASALNIRKTRNTNYSPIGSIPSGTKIYVSSISGGWGYVTYNKVSGYVSMSYLKAI